MGDRDFLRTRVWKFLTVLHQEGQIVSGMDAISKATSARDIFKCDDHDARRLAIEWSIVKLEGAFVFADDSERTPVAWDSDPDARYYGDPEFLWELEKAANLYNRIGGRITPQELVEFCGVLKCFETPDRFLRLIEFCSAIKQIPTLNIE